MCYTKRVYIEEIPRVSIGKNYRAIETLLANKGGMKMTINDPTKKLIFYFRYYKHFPIPEDGVVVCSIPCNYGGLRYFYLCPLCRKRYRHLYITQGKKHPRLLCRKCCHLSYRTQSENECTRLATKLVKLLYLYRLKNKPMTTKDKPKGIHKRIFKKIIKKIDHVRNQVDILQIKQDLL